VAGEQDVVLGDAQRIPLSDPDLLRDQVEPGDRFGDRVLNLDTRVHLEEVERPVFGLHQELDGTEAPIAQVLAKRDCRLPDGGAQLIVEPRRGGLLH
jgi:hypothetical protein